MPTPGSLRSPTPPLRLRSYELSRGRGSSIDRAPGRTELAVAALLVGLGVLSGCDNKCDELVKALADCEGSDVGATTETTDTTADPQGDTECSGTDSACSACILESKHDLCLDYGTALAECRTAGACE